MDTGQCWLMTRSSIIAGKTGRGTIIIPARQVFSVAHYTPYISPGQYCRSYLNLCSMYSQIREIGMQTGGGWGAKGPKVLVTCCIDSQIRYSERLDCIADKCVWGGGGSSGTIFKKEIG